VGEPLLFPELECIFKLCKQYGFLIKLSTNGQLIHKWIDLFYKYPGVVKTIRFSIDGATEETYEKIRRGGKFKKLLENLELVSKYNADNSGYKKIHLSMDAVISEDNIKEIPLFFRVYRRFFNEADIKFGFVASICAKHEENGYYQNKKLKFTNLEKSRVPCNLLWNSMYILYNGDVSLCCQDYHGELVIGNIKEKTIEEIWNNEKHVIYRKMHAEGRVESLKSCQNCYHSIQPETYQIINSYIQYLFLRRPEESDEFYIENILNTLYHLNNQWNDDYYYNWKFVDIFS
jgi:radical SAM protein with 4Fe4S-binding SPASM domain